MNFDWKNQLILMTRKQKTKCELEKIIKNPFLPISVKSELLKGIRAEIKKIEEIHGKCDFQIKVTDNHENLPTISIIPKPRKNGK